MTENCSNQDTDDYICRYNDDLALARRRIEQIDFLAILMLYPIMYAIYIYPFIPYLTLIGLIACVFVYVILMIKKSNYKNQIIAINTMINIGNTREFRAALLRYSQLRAYHFHQMIDQYPILTNFDIEYNGKCSDMPVYKCPICGCTLDYSGFYFRNRDTWKGSLQEFEQEWLKYDHDNLKNNVTMQLLCCKCHDKIEQDQKIQDLENRFLPELEERAFNISNIQPVRNALDLNGNIIDLEDFNHVLYGDDDNRENTGGERISRRSQ